MNEKLTAQMERVKAEMAQETERYYEELSRGCEDTTCKISGFERMMVNHRKRTEAILLKATGEALSSVEEAEGKKMSGMRRENEPDTKGSDNRNKTPMRRD